MKRVSYDDIRYIAQYKQRHFFGKYFCNWYIDMINANSGWFACKIKLWVYILIFIPMHLIFLISLLWDGGIKNFEIMPRTIQHYYTTGLTNEGDETQFGRLKLIYRQIEGRK